MVGSRLPTATLLGEPVGPVGGFVELHVLSGGESSDHAPQGAVLILQGWFPHACETDACRHEEVEVEIDANKALLIDARPESLVIIVPQSL